MSSTPFVVHPLSPTGGWRVTVHSHGYDEILGTAYSDCGLVFLQHVVVQDPDGILDDDWWIEWRGNPPHPGSPTGP